MRNKSTSLEDYEPPQYCFPLFNSSCTKEVRPVAQYVTLYTFFFSMSVLTVFFNLLVIISISHFKQLHTPTNLLILSLAVADLMVGLFVMPVESLRVTETCWYLGEMSCTVFPLFMYVSISASLANLVFISIDRYFAVSDPLLYSSLVTTKKTSVAIFLCWICSLIYSVIILRTHLFHPERQSTCYGECLFVNKFAWVVIEIVFSLIVPCCLVMSLYVKIFYLASYQAKLIKSMKMSFKSDNEVATYRSEWKAAKTLGIVVVIYLLCWIPYYIYILTQGNLHSEAFVVSILSWIMYVNSCMNPLIYALFYPWFRVSAKYILTLKILEQSSSFFTLYR